MTLEQQIERFLAAAGDLRGDPARLPRPTCATSPSGTARRPRSSDVDVRVLADYTADLGRARPGGKLAPATIARRLAAVRSLLRFALGPARVPDVPLAPRRVAPPARRAEAGRGRRAARRRVEGEGRWRCATAPCSSSSTRPACAAPRRSGSTSATSTSSRSTCTCATARARRTGRPARRGGGALGRALPARGAARARARRRDALFLSARGRRLDTSTLRRLRAAPAPPAARVRDAPARGRRRPAHDPGAARPRLALDDADLQPRRREAPTPCLRPRPSRDPDECSQAPLRPIGAIRTSRASSRCSPPGARRGRSTRTGATCRARAPSSASRSAARPSTSSSATRRSCAPTASRARRSPAARRRPAASSATCSCSATRADNPAAELAAPAPRRARCRRRSRPARPSG